MSLLDCKRIVIIILLPIGMGNRWLEVPVYVPFLVGDLHLQIDGNGGQTPYWMLGHNSPHPSLWM